MLSKLMNWFERDFIYFIHTFRHNKEFPNFLVENCKADCIKTEMYNYSPVLYHLSKTSELPMIKNTLQTLINDEMVTLRKDPQWYFQESYVSPESLYCSSFLYNRISSFDSDLTHFYLVRFSLSKSCLKMYGLPYLVISLHKKRLFLCS